MTAKAEERYRVITNRLATLYSLQQSTIVEIEELQREQAELRPVLGLPLKYDVASGITGTAKLVDVQPRECTCRLRHFNAATLALATDTHTDNCPARRSPRR